MLEPRLRRNSVLSPSVLGELEANGVHTSKRASILPLRESRECTMGHHLRHHSNWRQRPPERPRKDGSKNRHRTLVNQRQPELVDTFEVDILDALDISKRSTVGWKNGDPDALWHCQ
jgi:hypothetical protein